MAFETNFRAGFQLGRSSMAFCEKLPHLLHLALIAPEWLSLFPDQKGFTGPASQDKELFQIVYVSSDRGQILQQRSYDWVPMLKDGRR